MESLRSCKSCLLPETYETLELASDDSSCNMCKGTEFKQKEVDWTKRKKILDNVIEKYRGIGDYDCLVPFSGGKDSTYQVHYIKNVLGYNPLLVTYFGNNFSEVGLRNLYRMKESLGVDHLIYYPNVY